MLRPKRGQPGVLSNRNRPFHVVTALAFVGLVISLAHMQRSTSAHSSQQQGTRSLLSALSWSSAEEGSIGSSSDAALADLISAPAAVHGWVKKTGRPVALIHWHDDLLKQRRERFLRWLGEWSSRPAASTGEVQPAAVSGEEALPHVIIPPCQIFVNHAYRFLYIRLPKTGSTSLVKYFTECEFPHHGPACMQRLPANTSREEVGRLFADYFVFTLVRNPYQRALSSYKYVISKMRAEPGSCSAGLSWDLFVKDPMGPGGRCRSAAGCCTQSAGFFWHHVSRQSRCMLDDEGDAAWAAALGLGAGGMVSNGTSSSSSQAAAAAVMAAGEPRWAVDYIARTEHMAEDLAEILREIDRRRDPAAGLPVLAPGLAAQQGDSGDSSASDGGEEEDVAAAAAPRELKKRNAVVVCAESGGRLGPQKKVAHGEVYLAAAVQEQYCREEEYFMGRHASALPAVQELYRQDLALLYPSSSAGAAAS